MEKRLEEDHKLSQGTYGPEKHQEGLGKPDLCEVRPCPHVSGSFFFPQIFFCGCENFRVHTQHIRIVFSHPHVSDCIRKFSDLL